MSQTGGNKKDRKRNARKSPPLLVKRPKITNQIITEKQDLLKSVVSHSEKVIHQLLKNLHEADNVVREQPPPYYLTKLIKFLKDDIEPLADLIPLISTNAEKLGSLKTEFELHNEFIEGMKELHATLSETSTNVECAKDSPYHSIDRLIGNSVADSSRHIPSAPLAFDHPSDYNFQDHTALCGEEKLRRSSKLNDAIPTNHGDSPSEKCENVDYMFLFALTKARQWGENCIRKNWNQVCSTMTYYQTKFDIKHKLTSINMFIYFVLACLVAMCFLKLCAYYGHDVINQGIIWLIPKRRIPM